VDVNPDYPGCGIMLGNIREMVESSKCDVLIVDNLSALLSNSAKEAEVAINAIECFKTLQKELGITVIVCAHTPKRYDASKPLRVEDVAGSKMLTNFADSIFFIAASNKGKSMRYLKIVKQRNAEIPDKVYDLELKQTDSGLEFAYLGMSSEFSHLKEASESVAERNTEIIRLYKEDGKTMEEIAAMFGINKSTVSRIINPKD
jgi:KaiC/GvpD/RAD55 family RecA-like ATPase